MNVYGYVRLSRDEDSKKESIGTQRDIIVDYAKEKKMNLINILEDDNVSGYGFDRDGLNELQKLVEKNKVDILLVKDLSRIGRHNAKTLIFLEYLDQYNVRLICITENIDTKKNDNDMLIGIKTWYNEIYVKDISRKIKSNIRQKQNKEGLVIVPTYGYMKDPDNKKNIIIDEEAAQVVKLIFDKYIEGYGVKKIAKLLNEKSYPTPSEHKRIKFNIPGRKVDNYQHLWYETSIRRILKNDAYIGTLRCGVTKLKGIKGKKLKVDESEHIKHYNYFPSIINKSDFKLVQELFKCRLNNNIRAKNEKIYRYAGILKCNDCGKGFVARKREGKVYYTCATYHRYGKNYCTPHRIYESDIDDLLYNKVKILIDNFEKTINNVNELIKQWYKEKKKYTKTMDKIKLQIFQVKDEIKNYARQLAKNLISEEIFKELTKDSNKYLKMLEEQLDSVKKVKIADNRTIDNLEKCKKTLELIVNKEKFQDKDIHLLVHKINIVKTNEIGKYNKPLLNIDIELKSPYSYIDNEGTLSCDDVISLINMFNKSFQEYKKVI